MLRDGAEKTEFEHIDGVSAPEKAEGCVPAPLTYRGLASRGAQRDNGEVNRILVSLQPGVDPGRVAAALREHGATASEPAPELPDVIVAEIPDADAGAFLDAAARIPGVAAAEPDALSFTEPDSGVAPGTVDNPPPGWASTEPE